MLSRDDVVGLKLEQLEELKRQMRSFDGDRLARLKSGGGEAGDVDREPHEEEAAHGSMHAESPDAGDDESPIGDLDAAEDGDAQTDDMELSCPHCGEGISEGDTDCPHCDGAISEEGGGEEDGDAEDVPGDGDRLAALAHKKMKA